MISGMKDQSSKDEVDKKLASIKFKVIYIMIGVLLSMILTLFILNGNLSSKLTEMEQYIQAMPIQKPEEKENLPIKEKETPYVIPRPNPTTVGATGTITSQNGVSTNPACLI